MLADEARGSVGGRTCVYVVTWRVEPPPLPGGVREDGWMDGADVWRSGSRSPVRYLAVACAVYDDRASRQSRPISVTFSVRAVSVRKKKKRSETCLDFRQIRGKINSSKSTKRAEKL
jgi:hypothetical protein